MALEVRHLLITFTARMADPARQAERAPDALQGRAHARPVLVGRPSPSRKDVLLVLSDLAAALVGSICAWMSDGAVLWSARDARAQSVPG